MKRINVTKTFLPPIEEYQAYLAQIWQTGQLTNQGPLLQKLEDKLKTHLDIPDIQLVANGTLALQLALRSLGIQDGEVITTPFSYVASTSAILWEGFKPVFVDIDQESLCIDAHKIEAAITPQTKAILAVHVFGNPCDVEVIEAISREHQIPVIYDAAHAFGVTYKGKSLLAYGDVSTCSFHATKVFHTIEGGAVVSSDKVVNEKLDLLKRFGHFGDEHRMLGINAKASEFNAAMGLCNLDHIDEVFEARKRITQIYDEQLKGTLQRPRLREGCSYNYSYYPVIFPDEASLLQKKQELEATGVFPRRYFYPSLNQLPYVDKQVCSNSESVAKRIMCLPLYPGLQDQDVKEICEVILQ